MSSTGSASYHYLLWCLLQNGVKDLAVTGHAALSFALLVYRGEQGIAQLRRKLKLNPKIKKNLIHKLRVITIIKSKFSEE